MFDAGSFYRAPFAMAGAVLAALLSVSAPAATPSEASRIRVFESSLRPAVRVEGEPQQRWTLSERMAIHKVPGMSLAVIRNGKVAWAKGYGVLQAGKHEKVDTNTVFSVGSVSKVGAAAVTLRLVDAGKLDLDRDVNGYLSRWKLPENLYTVIRPVTLRGILSHSAGLTVHGFEDFQPEEDLPTLLETLEGRAPAKNDPVGVVFVPGARFQYSGGGVTLEQLVIEEVTGLDFPQAARQYLFQPLGMVRSTYQNPLPERHGNIAKAHGEDGQPRALPRGYEAMPEMAASGLWTTPSDYAQLVIALIRSNLGEAGFLSSTLAHQMMAEVGRSPFGLGPQLQGEGMERRFYHAGSNDSYRAWMEGHLGTGDGVVIFTNGTNGDELHREVRRAVALSEGWAPALAGSVRVPAVRLSAAELQERTGVYEVQPASSILHFRHRSNVTIYRVVEIAGRLHLSVDGDTTGKPLIPEDVSHFVMDDRRDVVSVEFVRGYDGRIGSLLLKSTGNYAIEARRVSKDPSAP